MKLHRSLLALLIPFVLLGCSDESLMPAEVKETVRALTGTQLDVIFQGTIFKNNGNGTFTKAGSGIPTYIYAHKGADLNGDGYTDVVVNQAYGLPQICLNSGTGDGKYTCTTIPCPGCQRAGTNAILDADGDKDLDIHFGSSRLYSTFQCLNNGTGTFTCSKFTSAALLPSHGNKLSSGDFDNNGKDDLLVSGGNAMACKNTGTGTTWSCTTLFGSSGISRLVDIDGDKDLDAVVSRSGNNSPMVCINAAGTWTCTALSTTNRGTAMAVGDFNNDKIDDVYLGCVHHTVTTKNCTVCYGHSSGASGVVCNDTKFNVTTYAPSSATGGDVNGDGYDDVVGNNNTTPFVCYGSSAGHSPAQRPLAALAGMAAIFRSSATSSNRAKPYLPTARHAPPPPNAPAAFAPTGSAAALPAAPG